MGLPSVNSSCLMYARRWTSELYGCSCERLRLCAERTGQYRSDKDMLNMRAPQFYVGSCCLADCELLCGIENSVLSG